MREMRFCVINVEQRQLFVEIVKENFRLVFSVSSRTLLPTMSLSDLYTADHNFLCERRRILPTETMLKIGENFPPSLTGTVRQSLIEYNIPLRRCLPHSRRNGEEIIQKFLVKQLALCSPSSPSLRSSKTLFETRDCA